jgi:uncharacterized membrane protein YecN with MAPEG domain
MQLIITPYYAAILALLFIILAVRTIKTRREHKVAIGDGGEKSILRASRVHANFSEYVPFSLLLIAMLEMQTSDLEFLAQRRRLTSLPFVRFCYSQNPF